MTEKGMQINEYYLDEEKIPDKIMKKHWRPRTLCSNIA